MNEWWEFKLSPLLAIFYATAVLTNTSLLNIWHLPILLLVSLGVGAIYVSVINDLTDIEVDRRAGKSNRFADKSLFFKIFILSVCLSFGIITAYFWTNLSLLSGIFYIAAWIAYALYSIYPFRFKNRGFLGVLGDASGAHFFPYLFVVSAAFAWIEQPINFVWLILVGIWSLACGVRGILWHQVQDFSSDKTSGVSTFVTKHSKSLACLIGERFIFPLEFISFLILLFISQNIIGILFLPLYLLLVWSRSAVWGMNIVIVAPHPKTQIIMNDYYSALLPLSVLILAAIFNPADIIIGMIHFILFPKMLISIIKDTFGVIKDAIDQNRNHEYPLE